MGNLFVVWLLTGVWHGANWTFLCWGLLYFVLLVLEKFAGLGRGWPACLRWLFTMLMVNFAWVLFRAEGIGDALRYFRDMLFLGSRPGWDSTAAMYLWENLPVLIAAVIFAAPVAGWVRDKLYARRRLAPLWDAGYAALLLAVFLVSASFLVKGTYNPFIYFNF